MSTAHSVRFEDGKSASGGAESAMSMADAEDDEMLVNVWRQSPQQQQQQQSKYTDELPGDDSSALDIVNMPVKRNLDAWSLAEHMDMPVLLQVT